VPVIIIIAEKTGFFSFIFFFCLHFKGTPFFMIRLISPVSVKSCPKKFYLLLPLLVLSSILVRAQDPSSMGFSALSSTAEELISRGRLADADPYLQELMSRFEHAETGGTGTSLEPANWLAIQAKFALYQATAERTHLQEAERLLIRFIERYPRSERLKDVIQRQGMLYAELGRTEDAIKVFTDLLSSNIARQLSFTEEERVLHILTLLYYQSENLATGIPVFNNLMAKTRNHEYKSLAAAALFEAHIQAQQYDQAVALLPLLARESEARYRPRLNIAFFRASDHLSAQGRFTDASLMLTLAMTSPDMIAYFETNLARLKVESQWLKDTRPDSARLSEVTQQIQRIENNLVLLRELPSLESDLLVRRARNFTQTGRVFEAFWLFYRLYQEFSDSEQFEFFAFAAFSNARDLNKSEVALDIAKDYLLRFPEGRYAGDVKLGMVLIHRTGESWADFELLAYQYLEQFPQESNAEQILAMYGAHLLERGEVDRLQTEFESLARRFTNALYIDGTIYWRGMAALQVRDFGNAHTRFAEVARRFPRGIYGGESHFRMGVALFAMERFVEARAAFQDYQKNYPDDPNMDQSFYFLAQVALMANDLPRAVTLLRSGLRIASTDDMRDIFTFELAALLHSMGSYDDALELLSYYISDHPKTADRAQAALWKGKIYESKRMPSRMVAVFREAILESIEDTERTSVEAVISEYAQRIPANAKEYASTVAFLEKMENDREFLERLAPRPGELFNHFFENPDIDQTLYRRMRNTPELGASLLNNIAPLSALRQEYGRELKALQEENPQGFLTSLYESAITEGELITAIRVGIGLAILDASKFLPRMPNEKEMEQLGPLSLIFLANAQMEAKNSALAKEFAQALVQRFSGHDAAIKAHTLLAKLAEAENDIEEALRQQRLISELFPASIASPHAILEEGRLLTALGRYEQARDRYRYILQVSEWRGELYARAIYGIGLSFQAEGKFAEAHGYMERVFLAYHHLSEWAARAYLADARILIAMQAREDARNTLREALNGRLQNPPSAVMDEIRQLLSTL
jgi:TolA-binding protein